ncbi:MAG: right-handed parallel beta-helix repeat-containing protein [Phycisphaerales bacterium]|jgi:hypothetical protein|nr:right-handed parallel beta-helix repeat-containing protein [Phycisphaerales bacterium]
MRRLSPLCLVPLAAQLASAQPGSPPNVPLSPGSVGQAPQVSFERAEDGATLIVVPPMAQMAAPIVIQASGLYRLTGNVVMTGDASAFVIDRANVTLDLNGFVIVGKRQTQHGIRVSGVRSAIAIRNGVIRDFADGINLTNCLSAQLSDLIIETCNGDGVESTDSVSVKGCTFRNNQGYGASVGPSSRVSDCIAIFNKIGGIAAASDSIVKDCVANDNTIYGIACGPGVLVLDSVASRNGNAGIFSDDNVVVSRAAANSNTIRGINAGPASVIAESSIHTAQSFGIYCDSGVVWASSAASVGGAGIALVNSLGSAVEASSCGIGVGADGRSRAQNALATSSTLGVFVAGSGKDLSSYNNNGSGILATSGGIVTNSIARFNSPNYEVDQGRIGTVLTFSPGSFSTTNPAFNHE